MNRRSQRQAKLPARGALGELERGREAVQRQAWASAYRALASADRATVLDAQDLERLAVSAYLIGRDGDYLAALERAYRAHLDHGVRRAAARCAFWLGLHLLFRGETGRATGWFGRAKRLLAGEDKNCAEQGYLLLPRAEQRLAAGQARAAYAAATSAAAIGERCADTDLIACARHLQGRIRLQQGRIAEGLALLDEAMLAVTAGEVSPVMTGLVYCSVIEACQQVYALGRAREWTAALRQWCDSQPEMLAFTGTCMVHRAEIMQLRGAWPEAIEEAQRACARSRSVNRQAAAAALYQEAEVLRLRGDAAAAEKAYRRASRWGQEPQPGLALLRLAQGRRQAADAAIRRALAGATGPLQRSRLLPAYVEIMLATQDIQEARAACRELQEIALRWDAAVLRALSAQAQGAVLLAEGNAQAAARSLRAAFELWQQLSAPYEAARTRALLGRACQLLGDEEGAELELGAAKAMFEELGAVPELNRMGAPGRGEAPVRAHGLTPRELQVLRLVAAGKTNKTIASELSLSEKTVDRHLSNILTKLDVSSRTAATAFLYKHKLI